MRLNEFAPQHHGHNDGHERLLPWPVIVKEISKFMTAHGFKTRHNPDSTVQYIKLHSDDEDEQVYLSLVIGRDDQDERAFDFMANHYTNGEPGEPMDDYQGKTWRTAQGVNGVILKVEEAFGL